MNTVFICTTYRHLLISLVFIKSHKIENSVILTCVDHQDINENELDTSLFAVLGCKFVFIRERDLLDEFFSDNLIKFPSLLRRNLHFSFKNGLVSAGTFLRSKFPEIFLTGTCLYVYHDRNFITKVMQKYNNVVLVEDGLAVYQSKKVNSIVKILFRYLMNYEPFEYTLGEAKRVKAIYAFNQSELPFSVRGKGMPLGEVVNKITISEMDSIRLFFRFKHCPEFTTLLLTQALDVAGLCSNKEKNELYEEIISTIAVNPKESICIKPHPAENFQDYIYLEKKYPNVKVMVEKVPVELFGFLNPDEKAKYISLYTSSRVLTQKGDMLVVNLIEDKEIWSSFNYNAILSLVMLKLSEIY